MTVRVTKPVLAWQGNGRRVLGFRISKILLKMFDMESNKMQKLFYPKSVMVVGVSDTPTNLGKNIAENLDRFDFKGPIYLIGKGGGNLNSRKIYTRIDEIDASPDLVVFLIPAFSIPEAL
jgi:acyl-CoA synthetase (NDP forming)